MANIGDQDVAHSLERLYSEDADWNQVLSELSSNAVREHRELIAFLQASERLDEEGDSQISLSPQLLRPVFSTGNSRPNSFSQSAFITDFLNIFTLKGSG